MTKNDVIQYKSILKVNSQSDIGTECSTNTIVGSALTSTKTISKLSGPILNYNSIFLWVNAPIEEVSFASKMNLKSGHSQREPESLVYHHDLNQARESIRENKAE